MITCAFEDGGRALLRHAVVHAIVEDNKRLLLVKRAGPLLETGKWSLPSGFLDRDETAVECVVREVKEETGWDTKVNKLFKINTSPFRPKEDRQNITLEFIVIPIGKTGASDKEVSEVEWFEFTKLLPFEEYAFDHGQTIKEYLEFLTNPFPLPIII